MSGPLLWGTALPPHVEIYEVSPRDGLQNELRSVSTSGKAALIEVLVASGIKRVEVSSFVSPRWIPQLADAEGLLRILKRSSDVRYSALVPNLKGLDRARSSKVDEIAVFLSASESHSRKNINKNIAEAIAVTRAVVQHARAEGIRVRCYLSVVWGCPFEGAVPIAQVMKVLTQLADLEIYQFSLGDTIGVGTPSQTEAIVCEVLKHLAKERIALHLHDTRGTALANALVGLGLGIRTFDASVGGLGGCPYAPGAAGNLATEDLVYMLDGMGIRTGINLEKLVAAGELAQDLVGRKLPGKYLQAALGSRDRRARVAR